MILELGKSIISIPLWVIVPTSFLLAFAITSFVIPSIIKISNDKHLFDKPNKRKSHTYEIPTLGGAAVFIGMMVPTTLFGGSSFEHELKYITAGLLILFYIGIVDDILDISARKKFIAELLAIIIVVILGNIRISNFHGFLGVYEIPYLTSLLITTFTFLVIINGFNLIDGIDGLSSGVGTLSTISLGIWFLLIGDNSYAAFCFSTAGALLAFFFQNVFGKKNKIFLGDTGSLILGMVISIFTITFLETSLTGIVISDQFPAPTIAIAILIIPLIDTLRVFVLRVLVGKSPFKPDRFHTHHKFLLLGYSHFRITLIMLLANLVIILLSVSLISLGNIKMLLIIIPASILITSIPGFIFRFKVRKVLGQVNILGKLSWILPITFTNLLIKYIPWVKYKGPSYMESQGRNHNKNEDLDKIIKDAYIRFENGEKDDLRETSG